MTTGDTGQEQLRRIARRVMIERGMQPDFSPAALAQSSALAGAAMESGPGIRDLSDLLWASIDNDDSRDLDQLSVAESLAGGAVRILVAIADVDSTVSAGCAIDEHARINTTSVYTAAEIFPMLPEKLSTDLTSLGQDRRRLAIVIDMTITSDGEVAQSDIYRAVVRNRAKLAYRSVAAWLDGTGPAPAPLAAVAGLDQQLRLQDQVAQALLRTRHQRGALSLQTVETRPVFDNGLLTDLRPDQKNRAEQLIEDFMIAANGVTARFLEQKGSPSIRRVLRTPKRWDRIVVLASQLGEQLPALPDAPALNGFLEKRCAADPERFPDLSLSIIKLLGAGEYVVEQPGQPVAGHFGLAVQDYTHSTAPNRRFPDLITQRLLKAALAARPAPYSTEALETLATHCTEQEDQAARVERQVHKSAAAMLLSSRIGQHFDAIVTGASEAGTWIRTIQPPVEGRVVKGFEGLDVGDRVGVTLVHTDIERGFIDFARVR